MATQSPPHLAVEARQRVPAAIAALAAGLLTLAGPAITLLAFTDRPVASWLAALNRAGQPGPVDQLQSLRIASYKFYDSHSNAILASSILRCVALLGLVWAIVYLARAVKARRPGFQMQWLYVAVVGAVLAAIGTLAYGIGTVSVIDNFLGGSRTVDAATDVTNNSFLMVSGTIAQLANLPLAAGMIFIVLNAMRVGLLTRFMGVLGIIVGALFFLPITASLPVITAFWLIALAVLYAGYWPRGIPPAWITGQAEPWPSRQPRMATASGSDSKTGSSQSGSDRTDQRPQLPGGSKKRGRSKRKMDSRLDTQGYSSSVPESSGGD